MKKYQVLSLDGGGVRGIVSVTLLHRLKSTPGLESLLDDLYLVAGTSTGGLIALALADGTIPLHELHNLYVDRAADIFRDTWFDDVADLGKFRGADYSTSGLKGVLHEVFGFMRLRDLKKHVVIPAFDLDNQADVNRTWKPKIFHNMPGPGTDRDRLVSQVALYTCAAPTYFPSVDGYIDGGVYANNPAMCALAQTQDERYGPPLFLWQSLRLLSIGTGTNLQYIKGDNLDWGYAQWGKPIINLMFDGVSGITDYQCRQLLGDAYHRLAPIFPQGWICPMDAVKQIPKLIDFAHAVDIQPTVDWLKANWF